MTRSADTLFAYSKYREMETYLRINNVYIIIDEGSYTIGQYKIGQTSNEAIDMLCEVLLRE